MSIRCLGLCTGKPRICRFLFGAAKYSMKKKKPKDLLSHKQYEILMKNKRDSKLTQTWLVSVGLANVNLNDTDTVVLQAKRAADRLIKQQCNLLDSQELIYIKKFRTNFYTRTKANGALCSSAYKVLNISRKINRQIFKQFRGK